MSSLYKLYYYLTAHYPRRMPETESEYLRLKEVLLQYFGVEDTSYVWVTVAGLVQNTKPTSIRKSYGSIANGAKRLKVNAIAQDQKVLAGKALEAKLKELAEKMVKESERAEAGTTLQGESYDISGAV